MGETQMNLTKGSTNNDIGSAYRLISLSAYPRLQSASSPRRNTNRRRIGNLNMEGGMDIDAPEQRGTKRPVEEASASGHPKPKRIKVGECQLIMLL